MGLGKIEVDSIGQGEKFLGESVRRGSYVNGKRDGLWEFYRDEKKGVLAKNGNYKNGKKHAELIEIKPKAQNSIRSVAKREPAFLNR